MRKIKGKKVSLRFFKRSDAKELAKNANHKEIYKNTLNIPYPYSSSDAKKWIEKNIRENKKEKSKRKMVNFVIEVDEVLVGTVGFSGIEKGHKTEIGYWIGKDYWGRGITTEALKLGEKYMIKEFQIKRFFAQVFSYNKASMRVLEKNNYREEGLMKKHIKKDGKLIDTYIHAKIIR